VVCAGEDIVFMATDITLPGSVDWVMLQSCFDANFLLVLEKQDKPDGTLMYYAIVLLIGTKKQTEEYCYRYGYTAVYFIE
jgi:Seven in absentia protein family